MSKYKLTNQLKKAYKSLEEEFKNKGRPNTIEDNNVDYDNTNIYAMRQKISQLEEKLALTEKALELACEELHDIKKELWENDHISPYEFTAIEEKECFKEDAKEMMKSE